MNKKLFLLPMALLIAGCSLTGKNNTNSAVVPNNSQKATPTLTNSMDSNTNPTDTLVGLKTKDGQIVIKLYTDKAPNTVKNFLAKAKSGFYKNLTFHRVEPGFVVQGGDPLGNGTGGGNIKSEINDIPFKRGSVGLARGGNIQISNDSQFYICLATETCQHLDNQYVNFGEVVSGMDFVDKIRVGDKILDLSADTK